ncbi:transketolase [Acutalibacter sp. 1XD8-36]|uniref:transketolase n=1 Tax=Acutalibacter sp. 1XD8-36 TaxID=2320852 RepID=UPI00261DAC3D|nr:transketolase [Acutalibacter sp. 1XD8-36]
MIYTPDRIQDIEAMAKYMRLTALDMALAAGKGGAHLGGGLSCIEIFAALYGGVLRFDAKNPCWKDRDRFFVSKNHCVLAQFPALYKAGFIEEQDLRELTKDGGRINGYPRNVELGLEYSGGSLGMAISVAIGVALALRERKSDAHVYVLMGDGELNEGSVWEAFMSAAQYKLDNLTAIIDRNYLCVDGNTEEIMGLYDLPAKFSAFGWSVDECDGHNIKELLGVLQKRSIGVPHGIVAETVKGKGVSFIENRPEWHRGVLSQKQYEQAKSEVLGGA